ncbi:MAG: hypothetical protein IKQ16_07640 [Lentisphaeria bacterium]|jgi:transcription antitermination factor NusG|nr:hypothetical protein [Lentisphaeria bacterium]
MTEQVLFEKHEGLLWQPVYTLCRNEKKVFSLIDQEGFPVYLPMKRIIKVHPVISKGRSYCYKREFILPMFSNYLFACIPPDFKSELMRKREVIRILPVDEATEDTLLHELEIIRKLENVSRSEDMDVSEGLKKGIHVVFTEGPFKGEHGVILDAPQENGHVYINVTSVESSVRIQYPAAWCKAIA